MNVVNFSFGANIFQNWNLKIWKNFKNKKNLLFEWITGEDDDGVLGCSTSSSGIGFGMCFLSSLRKLVLTGGV